MIVKLVKLYKNKIIKNKKGNIIKYVSTKDFFFKKFGEIYFSEINPNKKKGWTLHKKNTCLIMCLTGKVKFHIIDKRGRELNITLNSNKKKILKIPPGLFFSFKSFKKKSLIVNCIENAHRDQEVKKYNKISNYLIN